MGPTDLNPAASGGVTSIAVEPLSENPICIIVGTRRPNIRMRAHRLYIWRLKRSLLRAEFHIRIAAQVATAHRGGWILDIGCGPGLLEVQIASRVQGSRIVGLDVDRHMLRAARRNHGVEVVQAASSAAPFRDDSVGTVVSSLKDWGDRLGALCEVLRVMRPGRSALIFEFITAGPGSQPPRFARRFGAMSELARRLMRFGVPFGVEDARQLATALAHQAPVSLRMEPDLGVAEVTLRKIGFSATEHSEARDS